MSSPFRSPPLLLPTIIAAASIVVVVACSSSDDASSSSSSSSSGSPNQSSGGTSGTTSSGGGSSGSSGASSGSSGNTAQVGPLSPLQKRKAEMLTSIWENSTTVLQYGFSQNIDDGRGYTSGRAGFCSGTGDAFLVVKCFDGAFGTGGGNAMHKYFAALEKLSQQSINTGEPQGNTSTLDKVGSYNADWTSSATNGATAPAFNGCQDDLVYDHYFKPAVATAAKWGLTQALSMAVLYDSVIVHGNEGNAEIVQVANDATNNHERKPGEAPMNLDGESKWLEAFLLRRFELIHSESVDRGALYEQLRRDANWDLSKSITTNAKAHLMFPDKGYEDSHYPSCTIDPAGVVSGEPACTK